MKLSELPRDIALALRGMRLRPAFAAIVIATVALGIGVNTAVFTVVRRVALDPLAFPKSDRLALLWKTTPSNPANRSGVAPADVLEIQAQNRAFASTAAFTYTIFDVTGIEDPYRVAGARVSGNFLATLVVWPARGRGLTEADDSPNSPPVAVINHALWQRVFGGDPGVIGRSIQLNGELFTVVGIMAEDFTFPEVFGSTLRPEVLTPLRFSPEEQSVRGAGYMFVLGRLASGVLLSGAQAEFTVLANRFDADSRAGYAGRSLSLVQLGEQVVGSVRRPLLVLWGAVACILLIACANLASMFLARGSARARDLALRVSLGASRSRITGQLLTESLVYAILGGTLGMALASAAMRLLPTLGLLGLPRLNEVGIDARVLATGFALSILTGLLFGALPAWQASRVNAGHALQGATRTLGGTRRSKRIRTLLVGVEVQLAVVLVAAAGLLVRSFAELQRADVGFLPEDVLTFELSLPRTKYERPASARAYHDLLGRLAARPGVRGVGAINYLPLAGNLFSWGFLIEGRETLESGAAPPTAEYRVITPGFFPALGVTLQSGREFSDQDGADASPVGIVNEELARRYWPNQNPIGKRFRLPGPITDFPWVTIVGVARDVRFGGIDQPAPPTIYRPLDQHPMGAMAVVARTDREPGTMVTAMRDVVREFDAELAVFNVREFSSLVSASLAFRRGLLTLLGLFGMLALFLAMLGIYGMTSYSVSQRIPEIGLRMALGADRRSVLQLVMRDGTLLAGVGLAGGILLALVLTRTMASLLYGVSPTDPLTLVGVSVLVLGVMLVASYLPARKAVRVDPMTALRKE